MSDLHLTVDDMPTFTRLRMTAFGEAVIEIANDAAFDDWSFSAKIPHALDKEVSARQDRRLAKLPAQSRTPNPAACVEDIHYLPDRSLNRDVISRLAACRWLDNGTSLVILGTSSVGKSYLAQALVNSACRHDYTARYYRLDDLANQLAIPQTSDPARMKFLSDPHGCDLLVLASARIRRVVGVESIQRGHLLSAAVLGWMLGVSVAVTSVAYCAVEPEC